MPAVVVGRPKRSEAMWEALKTHIIRERQKKKQGTVSIIIYKVYISILLKVIRAFILQTFWYFMELY
jgi:metal-responsive CopG/Arc/MetJ family transcriptional regulator